MATHPKITARIDTIAKNTNRNTPTMPRTIDAMVSPLVGAGR
jgi:hypothetical protein